MSTPEPMEPGEHEGQRERPDATAQPRARPEEPAAGVAGERGIPAIQQFRSVQSRISAILTVTLTAVLGVGMLVWYYQGALHRGDHARAQAKAAHQRRAQGDNALPPLGPLPALKPPSDDSVMAKIVGDPPAFAPEIPLPPESRPIPGSAMAKTPGQLAWERKLAGPVLMSIGAGGASATARGAAMPAVGVNAPEGLASTSAGSELADLLKPTATPAVRAQVLPTQGLLLPKGAFIDCTLETAISSALPGMTTCITATDTFSADGEVVLLERGTKLVGETRGQVSQGSARLFVLWTEARTPTGVVVPLASPGTDELGRSGLTGQIERHWWQRFGSAILVSIINGVVQGTTQRGSGGTVIYNPSGATDVMTEVLKGSMNIPSTIEKPSGDRIQVLVARDVDFRGVYQLKVTP